MINIGVFFWNAFFSGKVVYQYSVALFALIGLPVFRSAKKLQMLKLVRRSENDYFYDRPPYNETDLS